MTNKTMRFHLPAALLTASLLIAIPATAQPAGTDAITSTQELDSWLESLDHFRAADEALGRGRLNELEEKFRQALATQREKWQAASDLDGLLAIQESLRQLDEGTIPSGSKNPTIARLETIYAQNHPAAEADFRKHQQQALARQTRSLEELRDKLTQQGKTDLALAVRERIEEITTAANTPAAEDAPAATLAKDFERIGLGKNATVAIRSATYGSNEKNADVTAALKRLVETEKTTFSVNPSTLGADPHPYRNKQLTVTYTRNGKERRQRRGENETVLPSSFYGPQDDAELEKELTGTQWQAGDTHLEFRANNRLIIDRHVGSARWSVHKNSNKRITLQFSPSEKYEAAFDWHWSQFTDDAEPPRTFTPAPSR